MPHEPKTFFYKVSKDSLDMRLDFFLSARAMGLSRSRIQALIKDGEVKVNDLPTKPGYRLKAGDSIALTIPPPVSRALEPEAVDFDIVHEDDSLIVLDKPAGLVVHPAPGHDVGTLVHGLLRHCPELSGIGGELRPGIVHRLDKDTSGLMVVAKDDHAHTFLAGQFKAGKVTKEYMALVHGKVKGKEGTIDLPLARHPKKRKEMAVIHAGGRRALTFWKKIHEFQTGLTLLSVIPRTGRTHQIRVHLSHIGHPVAGDPVYGYGRRWRQRQAHRKKGILPPLKRQMLHAIRLGFVHPGRKTYLEFETPLPGDMDQLVGDLKQLDLK
ncbi:MAG: RluA family pseudouridine synthase [Deltaproteobacteria bacterium]|nr:RluA family pseudouridine synthase [Deltaproteobacteria bacterium]